jgi:hypothetical protein
MKSRPNFLIILGMGCAMLCSGCASSPLEGRQALVAAVRANPSNRDNWYYAGSDRQRHCFVTRIADVTESATVPVTELHLAPTQPIGHQPMRQVFPDDEFRFGKEVKYWDSAHLFDHP